MLEECPACLRGFLLHESGRCNKCGIAIARGASGPARWPFVTTVLPDQDFVSGGTDYARTKLDKLTT